MIDKNISKFFLNKILFNFINSKNLFYLNNKTKYTYQESYQKINKLVEFLNSKKIKKIILFSDKSINYYLIVISIILSRKTWIQISPNIPQERIKKIIKISKCKYAFYDNSFNNPNIKKISKVTFFNLNKILLTKTNYQVKYIDNFDENSTAMIFFTSGSTSIPKGVKISYRGFIFSALKQIENLKYKNGKEIFADYHDNSFVMSLNVIFPAVFSASAISPLIDQIDKFKPVDHLKRNKISVLITVPSFFIYINNFIKKKFLINKIIFCGENLSFNIFKNVLKKIKFNSLYNCYGATELSPWAFYYKYSKKDNLIINNLNQIPIGKCFEGLEIYLNKKNELCISGPLLSKGYLDKKNNKKNFFLKNNKRFYNTGDITKKYKNLYFILGRNDKQVKLKGYRIDLLEIENHIKRIEEIEFAMCHKKITDEKLLLLVITKEKNIKDKIIKHLSKHLPAYMIPSEIIVQKKIILNKNGKVDRKFYKEKLSK